MSKELASSNSDLDDSHNWEKVKGKPQNPRQRAVMATSTREPSSSSKKAKVRPKIQRDQQVKVTVDTLTFESVTGSECRT